MCRLVLGRKVGKPARVGWGLLNDKQHENTGGKEIAAWDILWS